MSAARFGRLTDGLPAGPLPDERFDTLVEAGAGAGPGTGAARVERIVSTGQASPPGVWYDQGWPEFVLLVAGSAGLEIEGEPVRRLDPGDWAHIPARVRHRVDWTDPAVPTVWLAIHFPAAP